MKTKVSGSESVGRIETAPTSQQITADASGARLLIPALSLRSAIAGLSDPNAETVDERASHPVRMRGPVPLDGPPLWTMPLPRAAGDDDSDEVPTLARPMEPTMAVTARRVRRVHSNVLLWAGAAALIALGLIASTTDTAELAAARIHMVLQPEQDAIPAAAADSLPAQMPPIETAVTTVLAQAQPASIVLAPPEKVAEKVERPEPEKAAAPKPVVQKPTRLVPVRSTKNR